MAEKTGEISPKLALIICPTSTVWIYSVHCTLFGAIEGLLPGKKVRNRLQNGPRWPKMATNSKVILYALSHYIQGDD